MFCVAAEIPLHGLSSSFPFSFSLAILLLSNQLAHAGRHPHHPAPLQQCQPTASPLGRGSQVPPQPSIPLLGERGKDAAHWFSPLTPWGMSSSEVQTLDFAGFKRKTKDSVFSVRAHTHTISMSNLSQQGAAKGRNLGKVSKRSNSRRKHFWRRSRISHI